VQNLTIGPNVRQAREALGLKQQVVAVRADVALRTLQRIEQGEDCNVSTLAKIAEVLGVPVASLLSDVEPLEAVG
jgi:transcriptional regulator with XRE-family HTH domain